MTFLELLKTKELLESIKQQGFKRGAKGTKKNSINEICVYMSVYKIVCEYEHMYVCLCIFICLGTYISV